MTAVDYEQFVAAKAVTAPAAGVTVDVDDVNPVLFPHQRDITAWAATGGRRAIFAAFGLGKTPIQMETLRLVQRSVGGPALIVCPLGVRQEFARDAEMLELDTRFIRRADEIDPTAGVIHLTNYETIRDGKLDPSLFTGISLDEASCLRSLGSKTTQQFIAACATVPYRFVATATPSPNEFTELLHYAEFLGVMDKGQALTRWFRRDSTKAGNLSLHPHKEAEFYAWLTTWAVFVQRPSDLGYSDDGYVLPELDVRWHEIEVDDPFEHVEVDSAGQGMLHRAGGIGVVTAAKEKRASLAARVELTAQLIADADPDEHFVVWHDLEDERRAIAKAIPDAVEVFGSLDLDERERRIIGFSDGETRILATKPTISGSGCNFQRHCHRAIYTGIGFNFNDFVQSIHRLHRFQQPHQVRIDLIHTDREREVKQVLQRKWRQHIELTERMSELIREHGLAADVITKGLTRAMGVERQEASGVGWVAANNDCVNEMRTMATGSVDQVVTSIPFSNQYEYSPNYADFGHTDDLDHFMEQMDFMTPELLRILKPGRVYCCHVKDRIEFGTTTGDGYSTVSPFHARILMHTLGHGFHYLGMITVATDVVTENNQSYRLSYGAMLKDGSKMGVGSPEYVLLFRKPQTDRTAGWADERVTKDAAGYSLARWQIDADAVWRSNGDRHLTPEEWAAIPSAELYKAWRRYAAAHPYDHDEHVAVGEALEQRDSWIDDDGRRRGGKLPKKFAMLAPNPPHPHIWHDVNRMHTLNAEQARRNVEQHICPLQFDIVDRLIRRYSNEGDVIFDPFGGLSTVAVRALKLGRQGRTVELNPAYWADGVRYLQAEERRASMPSLFDIAGEIAEAS